ncbi:hypothetical protein ACQJBY_055747 [Aegilops geniculata]
MGSCWRQARPGSIRRICEREKLASQQAVSTYKTAIGNQFLKKLAVCAVCCGSSCPSRAIPIVCDALRGDGTWPVRRRSTAHQPATEAASAAQPWPLVRTVGAVLPATGAAAALLLPDGGAHGRAPLVPGRAPYGGARVAASDLKSS